MVLESGYLTRRFWLELRVITKLTNYMFWFKDIAYLPHVEQKHILYTIIYLVIYIYSLLYSTHPTCFF